MKKLTIDEIRTEARYVLGMDLNTPYTIIQQKILEAFVVYGARLMEIVENKQ